MTNKEAIAILENLKAQGETFFSRRLALDLAIKALAQNDRLKIDIEGLNNQLAEHEEFWGSPCSITYKTCPECGEDISDEDEYTEDDEEEETENDL